MKLNILGKLLVIATIFAFGIVASAQKTNGNSKKTSLPKVTQIDEAGLKSAIKTNNRPLVVNFWATWCDPCREEFPDLVKLDGDYKGKIDFITVSLDDLAEINRDVPKFLADNNATMPAYLLKVADEGAVISTIAKGWSGGLPFTVVYNPDGTTAYLKQGKIKPDIVKALLDKLLAPPAIVKDVMR